MSEMLLEKHADKIVDHIITHLISTYKQKLAAYFGLSKNPELLRYAFDHYYATICYNINCGQFTVQNLIKYANDSAIFYFDFTRNAIIVLSDQISPEFIYIKSLNSHTIFSETDTEIDYTDDYITISAFDLTDKLNPCSRCNFRITDADIDLTETHYNIGTIALNKKLNLKDVRLIVFGWTTSVAENDNDEEVYEIAATAVTYKYGRLPQPGIIFDFQAQLALPLE